MMQVIVLLSYHII